MSRGDRIRTCDLLNPIQTRYQTAPRPDFAPLLYQSGGPLSNVNVPASSLTSAELDAILDAEPAPTLLVLTTASTVTRSGIARCTGPPLENYGEPHYAV